MALDSTYNMNTSLLQKIPSRSIDIANVLFTCLSFIAMQIDSIVPNLLQ